MPRSRSLALFQRSTPPADLRASYAAADSPTLSIIVRMDLAVRALLDVNHPNELSRT